MERKLTDNIYLTSNLYRQSTMTITEVHSC